MAQLTFTTPNGNDCYGCMALDTHSYYCEFFKEFYTMSTVVQVV